MNPDAMQRCPHYQIYSGPLHRQGKASYLVIRRCTLMERMLSLLEDTEEGKQFGEHLTIQTRAGRRYAFIGPDMDPVTQQTCAEGRCEACCTPAYERTLRQFGKVDPQEAEVGCEEESSSSPEQSTTLLPT